MTKCQAGSFCPRNPESSAVEELNAFDERTFARDVVLGAQNVCHSQGWVDLAWIYSPHFHNTH